MADMKAMTLRLPVDLAEQLEAVAAIDGKPIADVVRVAIANFIRKRKADPVFQAAVVEWITRLQRFVDLSEGAADDRPDQPPARLDDALVRRWTTSGNLTHH